MSNKAYIGNLIQSYPCNKNLIKIQAGGHMLSSDADLTEACRGKSILKVLLMYY